MLLRPTLSPLVMALAVSWSSLAATSSAFSAATTSSEWKPKIASLEERRKLRGLKHESELIGTNGFHHVEFYCGDARSMASRFSMALGMPVVGETGQITGNDQCVSYGLVSGDMRILLTAPYSQVMASANVEAEVEGTAPDPLPNFHPATAGQLFQKHGLFAKAVGVQVDDAKKSFDAAVAKGAKPVLEPTFLPTCLGQQKKGVQSEGCTIAEVELYGDVALRFVSYADAIDNTTPLDDTMPFLPHLAPVDSDIARRETFGIKKIDHAVGNVPNLQAAYERIKGFTGFHEFAEFTAEDVGTVDSGLNSVVLASDSEDILLPLNEPTEGKRKSQILTYLEQNEGPGLQHLALKTDDIFKTVEQMRRAGFGGFELMKRPRDQYYEELPSRLGDQLSPEQYEKLSELGILADADEEGVLLQIFTKPIGDRPTFFFEIIQRVGCYYTPEGESNNVQLERPGCGGFGQGNFKELFQAIEDHEKNLKV